ncbi:hypothetical protein AYO38_04090 [bacterium SCGC AG-212-C10]|nr:hypothetical protein AYO38_04090 [bacterium SCGC AG-212-C10]
MPPLRIGFIGAGANTRSRHIPGFAAIDGVELAGVVNRSRASSEKVAAEFGLPRVYDSPQELIADVGIDAVCIGTWPYTHREFTVAALDAGKHVLCEARMAMDADEGAEMLAASERHPNLVAQIVPAPFDLRSGETVTRLIREAAIGDIRELSVNSLNGGGLNPATPLHWRQRLDYSGHNLMSLGIWVEVVQRWLGDLRTVSGHGSTFVHERPDAESGRAMKPVEVPDTISLTGEMANGAHYTIRVSSVTAGAPDNGITIFGTTGTIRWSPDDTATIAAHGKPFEPIVPDAGTDLGWRVEQDFVASIRDGAPVRYTNFPDGVRYMRFIDAAWTSIHDGGRRVTIDPASN